MTRRPVVESNDSENPIDLDAGFLPIGHMRQLSHVTHVEGEEIEGVVNLDPSHWVFEEHFPGDPIFPGTLMIEAAGQLVAAWTWHAGQRGRPRLVRAGADFHSPVKPSTSRLQLATSVRTRGTMNFADVEIARADTEVATVEIVLTLLS